MFRKIMLLSWLSWTVILHSTEAKTYYFRYNKTFNQYETHGGVNLRVNSTSNNTTANNIGRNFDNQMGELRNHQAIRHEEAVKRSSQKHKLKSFLLDEEWDYNWKNITARPKLPPVINKIYETVAATVKRGASDLSSVRVLFNSMPPNTTIIRFNANNSFNNFNKSQNKGNGTDRSTIVTDVEIYFYVEIDKTLFQKPIILRLYLLKEGDHFSHVNETTLINPDAHKLLNVIYVLQAESGWQTFKLRVGPDDWLKTTNKTFGLMITISKPNEEQFSFVRNVNQDIHRTFIVIKSNKPKGEDDHCSFRNVEQSIWSPVGSCLKENFDVDFQKSDWFHFIISPLKFNAGHCIGHCRNLLEANNNTLTANYQKVVDNHFSSTGYEASGMKRSLCCVPTAFYSLPIMFYDKNGDVVIKIYDEMVVSTCGCR